MRALTATDLPWLHLLGRLTEHYYINQRPVTLDCTKVATAWIKSLALLHSQILDAIKFKEIDLLFRDTAKTLVRASEMLVHAIVVSEDADVEIAAGYTVFSSRVCSYTKMLGFDLEAR